MKVLKIKNEIVRLGFRFLMYAFMYRVALDFNYIAILGAYTLGVCVCVRVYFGWYTKYT